MSPARQSRVSHHRPPLLLLLLSLVVLLPAFPWQPAAASPGNNQPEQLAAQDDSPELLIAFLRQGNLWLMDEDGSDQREVAISEDGVQSFSWSPSGRYIAILHDSRLELYDVTSGELRDLIDVPGGFPSGRSSYGSVVSWAVDADELMVAVNSEGTHDLSRITPDGTTSEVVSYSLPTACGGIDGPIPITYLLHQQQLGSPFVRGAYEGLIWWTDRDIAFINTTCVPNISLDLTTGKMTEYPETAWLAAGPNNAILIQDSMLINANTAGSYNVASGEVLPIASGEMPSYRLGSFAWTMNGEIVFAMTTQGAESAFTSTFDDYPTQYHDNVVDIWTTDSQATEPRRITSLDVWGTGVPTIGPDGTIIVGAVDNPTALIDVDESQFSEYSPEIYAKHQRILRIDVEGEVTVLATNAYRPRLRPTRVPATESSLEEKPVDPIVTPTVSPERIEPTGDDPVAEVTPAGAAQPGGILLEPGSDWIAYVGDDSNIWLMRPDGSQQTQITTDGTSDAPYVWPTWSHDGTMLVFSRRPAYNSSESLAIYLFRDGVVNRIPNVHGCGAAAFMPGDQQLVLGCGSDSIPPGTPDSALQTDPSLGFVSMVDLDGNDWRVHVPYHRASDGIWPNRDGGPDMAWVESMSVHPDGTILLSFSGPHGHGLALLDPGSTIPVVHRSPLGEGGVVGRFFPGSDDILIAACKGCYPRGNNANPQFTVAWMDRNGAITTTLLIPEPSQSIGMPTISPDGGTLIFSTNRSIQSLDLVTDSDITIANGTGLSWQPNPNVTMELEQPAEPQVDAPTVEVAGPTEVVTDPSDSPGLVIEPGSDWIAYVGEDGNIWLMQPDGGQQTQVTTDGTPDFPYRYPSWSHDGTMLVFSQQPTTASSEPTYLYLLRDGVVSRLPSVYGCQAAAFMPGDQQLVLGCASDSADPTVPASTLQTDPSMGFVSLANLDGSDWHILMPYPTDPPGWPNVGRAWVYSISVAADGTILLNWGGPGGDTLAMIAPGASTATRLSSPLETGGVTGRFFPGSDNILVNACKGCYKHTRENPQHTVAWMNHNGAITTTLLVPDPVTRIGQPTISPDGGTLLYTIQGQGYPFYGQIQSLDLAAGSEGTIASGMEPAWQPNPGVTLAIPESSSGSQASQPSGSSDTSGESTTVPGEFLGTWNGWGTQVNPSVEWPLTINLTGGGPGSVVGTSDYPNDGCGGNLVLQNATTDTIVLVENLTYGLDACTDGGTITLGRIDGSTLSFDWSGTRKDGSASSATGSLSRSQPAADTSAPPPAATVPEGYLATWSGIGVQMNPTVEWPVEITITGGGTGTVVGTSDYPEQSCGGNLVLQQVTSDSIVMLEQLTYGQNACTDGGTITLSGLDVVAVQFSWTGTRSNGSSSSATGTLSRPDGTTGSSAPAGGQTTTQTGSQDVDGPVIDTTQLHSWYLGIFSGTGEQENPTSTWPITITFTGGRPGEVIGSVEYPTLGCGGELVLDSINPNDEWLGFKATERITYGHDNCIDGGAFTFSNESAVGITFHWTSPASETRARGNLPRVEPGAASEPANQSTEAAATADEVPATEEPVETTVSGGGPPSIYDAPASDEIVPIEPDGEGG